jgi:hypothetical protein
LAQVRQDQGVGLACHERIQHHARGLAEDIRDHRRQLEIGILQGFLHAIAGASAFSDQGRARASQVPQLSLPGRWDEAATHQLVLQQISNPLGVAHIGLAPRNRFDVLRIDDEERKGVRQQVLDRLPIHPG